RPSRGRHPADRGRQRGRRVPGAPGERPDRTCGERGMQLNHEVTVDAPLDEVWQALLDPHRVAPCMPGATLDEVNGAEFAATVQVKLGPVNLKYKGKGAYVDKDEQAKRLVIKASGKDVRGAGT